VVTSTAAEGDSLSRSTVFITGIIIIARRRRRCGREEAKLGNVRLLAATDAATAETKEEGKRRGGVDEFGRVF
jgi:hypothetical protein